MYADELCKTIRGIERRNGGLSIELKVRDQATDLDFDVLDAEYSVGEGKLILLIDLPYVPNCGYKGGR